MALLLIVALAIPLGLDLLIPVPDSNPLSAQKIALGSRLFSDKRLSRDLSTACISCHDPKRAFVDGRRLSVGAFGRIGRRNAPTIINAAYGRTFFWDARAQSLEAQVLEPIQDRNEMDLSLPEAAARTGLTVGELSRALASYVRAQLSGNSPYDRFVNGNRSALTQQQQAGLELFRGKANCTACHLGPTLTDQRLHNTGIAWDGNQFLDEGAGHGRFKTPTLRDVARTSPYMHNGRFDTLDEVIEFYSEGGRPNPWLDPEVRPLPLIASEKRNLRAFLEALNGEAQRN